MFRDVRDSHISSGSQTTEAQYPVETGEIVTCHDGTTAYIPAELQYVPSQQIRDVIDDISDDLSDDVEHLTVQDVGSSEYYEFSVIVRTGTGDESHRIGAVRNDRWWALTPPVGANIERWRGKRFMEPAVITGISGVSGRSAEIAVQSDTGRYKRVGVAELSLDWHWVSPVTSAYEDENLMPAPGWDDDDDDGGDGEPELVADGGTSVQDVLDRAESMDLTPVAFSEDEYENVTIDPETADLRAAMRTLDRVEDLREDIEEIESERPRYWKDMLPRAESELRDARGRVDYHLGWRQETRQEPRGVI